MKNILLSLTLLLSLAGGAQQFVSTGMIEYEVKTNVHKLLDEEDNVWTRMAKEQMPKFTTSYYQLTFNDNKAIYKFDRFDDPTKRRQMFAIGNVEDDIWYSDYATGSSVRVKSVDDNYLLADQLLHIDWKLSPNETREIAGFNCRKATGVIFDSVYVFAFYTDEITVSGGPMVINGLPGMILGLTIPRMYTSWIATKLEVAGVEVKKIVAPTRGKKKDPVLIAKDIKKAVSDWGTWGRQILWKTML